MTTVREIMEVGMTDEGRRLLDRLMTSRSDWLQGAVEDAFTVQAVPGDLIAALASVASAEVISCIQTFYPDQKEDHGKIAQTFVLLVLNTVKFIGKSHGIDIGEPKDFIESVGAEKQIH